MLETNYWKLVNNGTVKMLSWQRQQTSARKDQIKYINNNTDYLMINKVYKTTKTISLPFPLLKAYESSEKCKLLTNQKTSNHSYNSHTSQLNFDKGD